MPARCLGLLAITLLLFTGTSCSTTPPPPPPCTDPEPHVLRVEGGSRLNLGERGEPLATVVRIYHLKDASKLNDATFEDLLDRDKEVLADSLVSAKEVTITPGERKDQEFVRSPEVAYIAVVGLFRQPAGGSWRALLRLPPVDKNHCHADAEGRKKGPAILQVLLDESHVKVR